MIIADLWTVSSVTVMLTPYTQLTLFFSKTQCGYVDHFKRKFRNTEVKLKINQHETSVFYVVPEALNLTSNMGSLVWLLKVWRQFVKAFGQWYLTEEHNYLVKSENTDNYAVKAWYGETWRRDTTNRMWKFAEVVNCN